MRLIQRLKISARGDHGFTMVVVIMSMMVVSLLGVGAYAATVGDMPVARKDQDRKRAYEAAQAGVDWYLNQLRADPEWWKGCTNGPATSSNPLTIAPADDGTPSTSTAWQKVEDVAGTELGDSQFRLEIMRQNSLPCDTSDPSGTALDPTGTLWIRSTGAAGGKVRSVVAGLKEQSGFLKYLYFSNWESLDPQINNAAGNWAPDDAAGGNRNRCDYARKIRDTKSAPSNQYGQIVCVGNIFYKGDVLEGSIHTNDDSISNCGATIGRDDKDGIEVANAASGAGMWLTRQDGPRNGSPSYLAQENAAYRCPGGSPTWSDSLGTDKIKAEVKTPAETLQLPPSNVSLTKVNPLVLKGQTCIDFDTMKITEVGKHPNWGDSQQVDCSGNDTKDLVIPASGVIYVANNGSCAPRLGHNAFTSYTSSPSCGDVAVKGKYPSSVTIGAENDIIITGNLERKNSTALLGLIANNYVRIYQPLTGDPYQLYNQETNVLDGLGNVPNRWPCDSWKNKTGHLPIFGDVTGTGRMAKVDGYTAPNKIQAAVMSVQHTFVLDNGACENLGNLEFEGAIASYWGVNMRATFDGNYQDCKTGTAVQLRWSNEGLAFLFGWVWWNYPSNSPFFVQNGIKGSYELIRGIGGNFLIESKVFVPAGTTKCGDAWDTGMATEAGYTQRNWKYDDRLKHDQPPHFITPLNSDGRWVAGRRTEQIPTPVAAPPT